MKKLIAKQNFSVSGQSFIKGEEVKTKNYEAIVLLNEKGFIEPLTYEDLVFIKRELDNPKEKEEYNGT